MEEAVEKAKSLESKNAKLEEENKHSLQRISELTF